MRGTAVFLVGPSGSGKTALSLCLAGRLGGEIISADSMLVYKGMDIGTAKPMRAERQRVRHHLIDIVSPRSNFSVFAYRNRALEALEEISKRGRVPVVVGGSGLYVEALWKGLSHHPAGKAQPRKRFEKEAGRKSLLPLYRRLLKLDPLRARKIHPHDRRRIVRALEIAELSGKTPSEWYHTQGQSLEDRGYTVQIFGIARERHVLYERINRRVEKMFRKGFVREVRRLKRIGFSKTARQALGYREILNFLANHGKSRGTGGMGPLIRLIQRGTRRLAKRQLTWFRREKEIQWVPWREGESVQAVCDKIMRELRNG